MGKILHKIFLLDTGKLWVMTGGFIASLLIHDSIYAITGQLEPFFWSIGVILIPLYFIISLIATLTYHETAKRKGISSGKNVKAAKKGKKAKKKR